MFFLPPFFLCPLLSRQTIFLKIRLVVKGFLYYCTVEAIHKSLNKSCLKALCFCTDAQDSKIINKVGMWPRESFAEGNLSGWLVAKRTPNTPL